ncbi:MAG: DUF4013 domain-containing protein [Anaerolineales bacterium]
MDIGKAFTFPFEDDEWLTKLFLGAIVSLVPILNFAWGGYTVDILRNVIDGVSRPLPTWSDFGEKFVKGFIIWISGFIYALPAFVVACVPLGFLIIPANVEGTNFSDALAATFTGVGIFLICILALYLLVLTFYYPAVYINFARKGTFGSCFEIGEIFKIISENTSKYLTAWLVSIVGAIVVIVVVSIVSFILGLIPCVGWILTWVISALSTVYLTAIYVHLFGQVVYEPTTGMAVTEP